MTPAERGPSATDFSSHMPDTDPEVQHRAEYQPDPDRVEVRDDAEVADQSGMFSIRMPVTSTAEARDGEAFTRERLRGFRDQIATGDIGVFLDHGRNSTTGSRYSALGKIGYWARPDLVERDGATELEAEAVLADPQAMDLDPGPIRNHIAWLKTQAEVGIPLASSVGWSEDTGEREIPGDADLLEISIVGIPSDPRTTTASAEPATLARAVSAASSDFNLTTFERELRRLERDLPDAVVDELGDLLEPNAGAIEAAQQAIDWAEEYPDEFALGSEDGEGLRRARQLVEHDGERLTGTNEDGNSYWVEIEGFHSRHHAQDNHLLADEFEGEPWRDAGYVAHLAWGGDEGYDQAQDVVAALEALADDDDVDFTMRRGPITQAAVKDATPVHVDGEAEPTDGDRNLDDPAFSEGDAVMWTWQDEPVHGRVAGIHEQYTPPEADEPITGEDGEAVYSIYEWDEQAEAFDHVGGEPNVAKPQSSLDESTADIPTVSEDTMSDDSNDTEPDAESGADEEEPTRMEGIEEKMSDMHERIVRMDERMGEMHEEMMGDGENADDGDEDDDEDDDMDEESADADEDERAETPPGLEEIQDADAEEIRALREELRELRDADGDAEPAEPETQDRATDDEDSADTESSGSFWS